jgi:hypothetical protein
LQRPVFATAPDFDDHIDVTRDARSVRHPSINYFWGDDNGAVSAEDVRRLASAFPRGAAGSRTSICRRAIRHPTWERGERSSPTLKTIWAYRYSAPGSHSGATAHQRRWDLATRGSRDGIDRSVAGGTLKGEEAAVWSHV